LLAAARLSGGRRLSTCRRQSLAATEFRAHISIPGIDSITRSTLIKAQRTTPETTITSIDKSWQVQEEKKSSW